MRIPIFASLCLGLLAGSAAAQTYESCTKSQITYATAALEGAEAIVLRAAAQVGDTPAYTTWFGRYSSANAEVVRATLKGIAAALVSDQLTVVCPAIGEEDCTVSIFANVRPDSPFVVNLCPAFFRMPSMLGIVRTSSVFDTGTREGTIIHEVSHFDVVGGTDDHCYGRELCTDLARTDARRAIDNADSYQYFAEDITFTRAAQSK
jgi:peptidyl-Lys metalloendopeptidase